MAKIPKRLPRDVNTRAVTIARMLTGENEENTDTRSIESIAKMRGRASKGGHARTSSLTKSRRSEIAKKAAGARWRNRGH